VFFGSQEAVKKIWSKTWIFHGSKVVEQGKYSLLRLKTNIVSFKNRLKTRVALIELLDLSGIAAGNVGVPTCFEMIYT
jgi:hypothetical protein